MLLSASNPSYLGSRGRKFTEVRRPASLDKSEHKTLSEKQTRTKNDQRRDLVGEALHLIPSTEEKKVFFF
jgi:hypothetical protein